MLDMHPFSFIDLIHPTLEFTVFYVFSPAGSQFIYERFTIQCFNLIKGILLCAEYKSAKVTEDDALRAQQIKSEFLRPEILQEMCSKLVSHYFLLKQDDLEMWETDPETFVNDEVGESWKYSLRVSRCIVIALKHCFVFSHA